MELAPAIGAPLALTYPRLPNQSFFSHLHLLLFSYEKGNAAYLRQAQHTTHGGDLLYEALLLPSPILL